VKIVFGDWFTVFEDSCFAAVPVWFSRPIVAADPSAA
jgi:hypothetical protein